MTTGTTALEFREDDLSGDATRALIDAHVRGMREGSPEESCHVLDLDGLRDDSITFWSAWHGDELAGIGALRDLGDGRGELKSMRVDDRFRGTGVGRALLRHLIAQAQAWGLTSVWLETGAQDAFLPARRLYASEGFTDCPAFPPYRPDPASVFMTRGL